MSGAANGRAARAEGFTLIEVIVAVAVLAIISAPLAGAFRALVSSTTDVGSALSRTRDMSQLGAAWLQDVESLARVGADGGAPCPGPAAGTDLVTFYAEDDDPNAALSITWAVRGSGTQMAVVRRTCSGGTFVRERTLASSVGVDGRSPLQVVHGPVTGHRDFCTSTTCTLQITGSRTFEVVATRRATGSVNLDAPPPAPGPPQALPLPKGARVTWTAPALPSHTPAITSFSVQIWSSPSGGLIRQTTTAATTTTADFTDLTPGLTYWAVVYATNSVGSSEPSAPAAVVPITSPQAPSSTVSIIATGQSGQLGFSLRPPNEIGGAAVTSWEVTETSSGRRRVVLASADVTQFVWDAGSPTIPAGGISFVDGVTYGFTVKACNVAGCSAPSDQFSAEPSKQPIARTGSLVLTNSGPGVVDVTGSLDPGSPIVSGVIWRARCGLIGGDAPGPDLAVTISNLEAGFTTCQASPTVAVVATVDGRVGPTDLAGVDLNAAIDVYGAPDQPSPPGVRYDAGSIIVTPAASDPPPLSGGTDPTLTYVATCGTHSSTAGPGPRTVSGVEPGSTVTCTLIAQNVRGFSSPTSLPSEEIHV